MKHGFILFFLILSASCFTLTAQTPTQGTCGTHGEMAAPMIERLLRNIESLRNQPIRPRNIEYVPVKFHLVAKTDGTGRVAESKVLDQLCALNEDYLPMNIQFYLKNGTFNYINNTTVYSNHSGTINTIMTFARDNNAINVFIVDDATPAGGGVGGGVTLGYYTEGKDWLVMRRDNVSATNSTLPHEMGHFFSLDHPFNGWDHEEYDPAVHGVPAPAMSPGGIPTEKADGSNCATAGDFICDTPADYNLGFGWLNCNYTGGALDPMGMPVNPDENLFMGYFLHCPRDDYYFSPMQQQIILADLNSSNRNYITPGYVPYQVELGGVPELLSPINAVVTPGYNAVNLEWTSVGGATRYILEISQISNFSTLTSRYVVNGTSKILTNLIADKNYYWKVMPYGEYRTCSSFTPVASFRTGTLTSTGETKLVENWSVEPNPVAAGQEISVSISSNERFEGKITVLNAVGQVVHRIENLELTQGEHDFRIPSSFLARGVYIVALETADVVLTKRVVVGN